MNAAPTPTPTPPPAPAPAPAPVYGLILAGGASKRMRRDKAALVYEGRLQLDRAIELARRHVSQVFISVRADQQHTPDREGRLLVVDSVESEAGGGPIVGIRSALAAHPAAAWLVIACDLPFLSDAALEQLLGERDPGALATAFSSTHDGLPEPLCAIWEPAAGAALAAYQQGGGRCPRRFMGTHGVKLLQPRDPRALDNVNTPEEYAQAVLVLGEGAPIALKIQYFALLREQAGRSEETLHTRARTPHELFAEVGTRYGFTLAATHLKVAVNGEFADWARPLHAGDAVVFIPPVAGG